MPRWRRSENKVMRLQENAWCLLLPEQTSAPRLLRAESAASLTLGLNARWVGGQSGRSSLT